MAHLNGTKPFRMRFKAFVDEISELRAHWKELNEYMLPRKGRYLFNTSERANDGTKKHQKIINGTATDSIRTAAAGLQSGLTSPSRPWFNMTLEDKDLADFEPVRFWLQDVRDLILSTLHRSNFYGSIHGIYREIITFGVGAMIIESDFRSVIRCRPFTIGEFYLGLDRTFRPDTLYRRYSMTAKQLKDEFGEEKLSDAAKVSLSNDKPEDRYDVIHCIQPRKGVDLTRQDFRGMAYDSVYFEVKAPPEKFLRESGYRGIPFVAARWDITSTDTYGECPGMDAKGDVQMLQFLEEKKLKKLDKHIDPPMKAPTSLKGKGASIISGDVTFIDEQQNTRNSFEPVYEIDSDFRPISAEIINVEDRINRTFYKDLFKAVLGRGKVMTAREIAEVHEEKFLTLGPVIERMQAELHDPTIDITYNHLDDFDLLPPPPPELEGKDINIEYISLLAQAQRIVAKSTIEETTLFIGQMAALKPEAVDKLDVDEAIDQFARVRGTPPRIVKSTEKVQEERAARAQALQNQALQEQAAQLSQTSKTLSDTEMGKDSALDRVLEGAPGARSR